MSFDLPWANQYVLNANKRLRVPPAAEFDPWSGRMDPQAPMVPGAAPDFPFQETAVQRPDPSRMSPDFTMPQVGPEQDITGIGVPRPMVRPTPRPSDVAEVTDPNEEFLHPWMVRPTGRPSSRTEVSEAEAWGFVPGEITWGGQAFHDPAVLGEDDRDQRVTVEIIDRDGNHRLENVPVTVAQTIAKKGVHGGYTYGTAYDGYEYEADWLGAIDHLAKPFEVFSETIVEIFAQLPKVVRGDFGDLDAPTLFTEGFVAAYEDFRDRPLAQQIILGIITDPAVMLKAITLSAKLARAGTAAIRRAGYIPIVALFRAQVVHAAPRLSDEAADDIARALVSKGIDDVIAATPEGRRQSMLPWATEEGSFTRWQEFLGRGEEMGQFARTPLSEKRAQLRLLRDEYGLSLDGGANESAAALRGINSVVEEVVTHEASGLLGKVGLKVLGAVVGPSITRSTPIGKLVTAYGRQVRSAHELVKIAMASAYDRHIGQFDEIGAVKDRVIPVNSKGEWLDYKTGKVVAPWQAVFRRPDQYSQSINPKTKARQVIDDVNRMTNDEVPRLLDDEGIVQHIRDRPSNEYYVPHDVQEIRGIDVSQRGLRADLRRHYDEVTDGMAAGIKYGTNPRQDIELYMKWAYRKMAKKQLDDALEEHGMTRSQLVPKDIHDAAVDAAVNYSSLVKRAKKLAGQVRIAAGMDKTLGRGVSQQEGIEGNLNAELTRLRGLLDDLPSLVGIEEAPGRQELIAARRNLNQAIKLQGATATALRNARSAVAMSTGKASARADEARRLDASYDRLVNARDEMVQASQAYMGDPRPVAASEIQQQNLRQQRFRTLGVEETRAGRAADAAAGRVVDVQVRRDELGRVADLVDEDLQVAKQLTSEAQANLTSATSQAGIEQAARGSIRGSTSAWKQEVGRLQNRLDRLLDPEKGRLAKLREKQSAQRAVLEFLSSQQDNLKTDQARAWQEAQRTKGERSQYIREVKDTHVIKGALWGPNQPSSMEVSMWRNRFFREEDAKLLKAAVTGMETPGGFTQWVTRPVVSLVNMKRSLVATLDAAEPFIQGLPVLASNPQAWARQTEAHYKALFDPAVQSRRIQKNLADYQWLARNGVPIGDLEFFAALETGEGVSFAPIFRMLPKGEEVQRYFRTLGKQTFGRFGAMYNTALGEARVQLLQSTRVGWKGTDAELAQYIRNLTGGLDARALGQGPGRTAAEGFWLAFSPRLLRATVALVGDAVQGGVPLELVPKVLEPVAPRLSRGIRTKLLRGKEVTPGYEDIGVDIDLVGGVRQDVQREIVGGYSSTAQGRRSLRTLATLAGGVTTTYIVTGMALGKDWDEIKEGLNPLNGKRFLAHQINGDWIGVGGQLRAMFQMMAALAVDTHRLATTGELPTKSAIFSRRDNPFLRFLSGRGAIGTQAVLQLGEAGAAAMGGEVDLDPFQRIDSWTDLGKVQGVGSLPFVLQAIIEGQKGPTVGAAVLGARTSEWVEYDGMRDNKGVRTEQLQHFLEQTNIVPGGTIQVEWEGELLEFDLPEEIVEFGDLQPREQLRFKSLYPSTFKKERQLVRDLAKTQNAPDWAITRVEAWDIEDGFVISQEASDRQLNDEKLGVKAWKKDYRTRKFDAFKGRQALYDYDKDEIEKPLDVFYAKMDEIRTVTDPGTGETTVDAAMTEERWRELDVWLSQQPTPFQIYVDDNTGLSAPTEETRKFDYGTRVLSERYWGPTDPVTGSILNFPAEHSQGNVPIWSKTGPVSLNIPPDFARIYKEHMTYPEGDPRTRRVTVLADEIGTPVGEEKEARKQIINHVEGQLAAFKKHLIWTDEEVRMYVWTYYNSSEESVFIKDYRTRLAPR